MRQAKKGVIVSVGSWLVGLVILLEIFSLVRPLPTALPSAQLNSVLPSKAPTLPWPTSGQSAIGAQGYGLLASSGTQTPAPTASIAKVITALAVLKQKPFTIGSQGPIITLRQNDVNNYNAARSEDGSVVPVSVGEQITERQALEAMLLPSANNMARSLAQWAFGSLDAYNTYANKMVKRLGMSQTTVTDASGLADTTVSSANDLVKLGLAAMSQPVLAQIVAEPSAHVPVVGDVQNLNGLLGQDGIVGIKTGNTEHAGGCFLFAAKRTIHGHPTTIVGVVMGAPSLYQSMIEARNLVRAVDGNFSVVKAITTSQIVATYRTRWGATTPAATRNNLSLLVWNAQPVHLTTRLKPVKPGMKVGSAAGSLTASSGQSRRTMPVIIKSDIPKPSIWWRLTHP